MNASEMKRPPLTTHTQWKHLPFPNTWGMEECYEASVGGFTLVIGNDGIYAPRPDPQWRGYVVLQVRPEYQYVMLGCQSRGEAEARAVIAMVKVMNKIAHDAIWQLIAIDDESAELQVKADSTFKDMIAVAAVASAEKDAAEASKPQPAAKTASGSIRQSDAYKQCGYCGQLYKDHPSQGAGFVAVCNIGKTAI